MKDVIISFMIFGGITVVIGGIIYIITIKSEPPNLQSFYKGGGDVYSGGTVRIRSPRIQKFIDNERAYNRRVIRNNRNPIKVALDRENRMRGYRVQEAHNSDPLRISYRRNN